MTFFVFPELFFNLFLLLHVKSNCFNSFSPCKCFNKTNEKSVLGTAIHLMHSWFPLASFSHIWWPGRGKGETPAQEWEQARVKWIRSLKGLFFQFLTTLLLMLVQCRQLLQIWGGRKCSLKIFGKISRGMSFSATVKWSTKAILVASFARWK